MRRITVTIALLLLLAAGPARCEESRVLVVYSGGRKSAYTAQWVVPALVNLLGHFDCAIATTPVEAYQRGEIGAHSAVFYLGFGADGPLPEAFLADVTDTDRPVCWMGGDIGQIARRSSARKYGFEIQTGPSDDGPSRVRYRSQVLQRPHARLARLTVTDPASCHVLARTDGGAQSLPYAVRTGRFWYFADIPLLELSETGSYLVLADQLHDILGQQHKSSRTALICISGVSAQTDPARLRMLVRSLQDAKLPIAISVIPVFSDPAHKSETPLSHDRSIVGVVRGAQRAGAAIILNGYTHQYQGRTGDDAEFWDTARNRPPPDRTPSDTAERIRKAIAEMSRCGLYPIVWSTPRGRASSSDYAEIAKVCSTAWERRLTSVLAPAPQTFPFLIARDGFGEQVIPDNLGLLRSSGDIETILEQARCQTVVPDPWLTVAVSPDAPLDAVKVLLSGIKEMGFEFTDLRRRAEWMKGQSLEVLSVDRETPLAKLIPNGWDAMRLGPGRRDLTRFESDDADGREEATLSPGALLIAYPVGRRPREIFAFEGGPEEIAQKAVAGIARAIIIFAVAACLLFILVYIAQITVLRRA
jgi:hypothetical protein